MVLSLTEFIASIMIKEGVIVEDDKEIYTYGLQFIISSTLQIILLLILSIMLGILETALIFTICFKLLKRCIGGYHADSHFKCILVSTVITIIPCYLITFIPNIQHGFLTLILTVIGFIIIYVKAPVLHKNSPKTEDEVKILRKNSVRTVTIISLIVIIATLLLPSDLHYLSLSGALGNFCSSITLMIKNKN